MVLKWDMTDLNWESSDREPEIGGGCEVERVETALEPCLVGARAELKNRKASTFSPSAASCPADQPALRFNFFDPKALCLNLFHEPSAHHGFDTRLSPQASRFRCPQGPLPQEEKVRTRTTGRQHAYWRQANPHCPSPRRQHQAPSSSSRKVSYHWGWKCLKWLGIVELEHDFRMGRIWWTVFQLCARARHAERGSKRLSQIVLSGRRAAA